MKMINMPDKRTNLLRLKIKYNVFIIIANTNKVDSIICREKSQHDVLNGSWYAIEREIKETKN